MKTGKKVILLLTCIFSAAGALIPWIRLINDSHWYSFIDVLRIQSMFKHHHFDDAYIFAEILLVISMLLIVWTIISQIAFIQAALKETGTALKIRKRTIKLIIAENICILLFFGAFHTWVTGGFYPTFAVFLIPLAGITFIAVSKKV